MATRDHRVGEQHALSSRLRRERALREEQSDAWVTNEVARELRRVSRRVTDEINSDPAEAERLRTARRQARTGALRWEDDEKSPGTA